MDTKSVLYAAVGAPVVAARNLSERAGAVSTKLSEQATGYGKTFQKKVGDWAVEGEKVIGKIGDQKMVEDISARVDLDQAKDQVSKLRDQLEEMLATWRTSFRPEESKTETAKPAAKTAAAPKKPAAKKPAVKKTASKSTKTSAAKTTASKSTKTSAAKTTRSSAAKTSPAKTSTASKAAKPS